MVQMSDIFNDSKTFVDKKMKFSASKILADFQTFLRSENIRTEGIRQFVENNFEEAPELEPFEPPDWVPYPSVLKRIVDAHLRNWASELNSIWKHLSRINTNDVKANPDYYSVIGIPNGFVVPGGRFREIYYWDAYWIINGLLICDMIESAKGMIDNLLYLVQRVGHVPNGGRIYYEKRTQPPMLTQMVESYYRYTHDFQYIASNIDLLDREMDYWLKTRSVSVVKHGIHHLLFRYYASDEGPRPESYKEDLHAAVMGKSEKEKQHKYTAIKSAAESGWDFSTRWFILDGENKGNLSNMYTQAIVPVDLNALMHKNFSLLYGWYKRMKNDVMARKYYILSREILTAIENVLWDEEDGIWMDYDLSNDILRDYFYMSNFVPLWTKSYRFQPHHITERIFNYMLKYNLDRYTANITLSIGRIALIQVYASTEDADVLDKEQFYVDLEREVTKGQNKNRIIIMDDFNARTGRDHISAHGVMGQHGGGFPTSTEYSGEQWDFPNAWPPLQAFLIQGLDRIGTQEASEMAFYFADKYIHSNYKGFKDLGVMFEKYDSLLIGRTGDGGEYDAQEGFGWTNGVAFEFLHRWGHRLRAFDTKYAPRINQSDDGQYTI